MKPRWLTPDTAAGVELCRRLVIPADLIHHFSGAIAALTDPENWEQHGTLTPEESAEACRAVYDTFTDADPALCEEPPSITEELIWFLIEEYGDDAIWALLSLIGA